MSGAVEMGLIFVCAVEKTFPKGARYATLSHCWGSHPIEVLTVERFEQFNRNIDVTDLAKTLVDVVEVVRAPRT
jgi:hypothetical protein